MVFLIPAFSNTGQIIQDIMEDVEKYTFEITILLSDPFLNDMDLRVQDSLGGESQSLIIIDLPGVSLNQEQEIDKRYDSFISRVRFRSFSEDQLRIALYSNIPENNLSCNINSEDNSIIISIKRERPEIMQVMPMSRETTRKEESSYNDNEGESAMGYGSLSIHRIMFPSALIILLYQLFSFLFSINMVKRNIFRKKVDLIDLEDNYFRKAKIDFAVFLIKLSILCILLLYCTYVYANFNNIYS